MLSRNNRFRGRRAINDVYRKGHGSRGPLFGVKVLARQNGAFRVAVVVSKKVSKSAVVRNRIRRKIYSSFRDERFSGLGAFDIVVSVFDAQVSETTQPRLAEELRKQLRSSGCNV